jgi:hypothetical protein
MTILVCVVCFLACPVRDLPTFVPLDRHSVDKLVKCLIIASEYRATDVSTNSYVTIQVIFHLLGMFITQSHVIGFEYMSLVRNPFRIQIH